MTHGLTSTGFNPKSAEQVLAEVTAAQRATPALGADFDNGPDSVIGQMNASMAAQLGEGWKAVAAVYANRDPRVAAANGQSAALDGVAALFGQPRRAAQKGTATLNLSLAPGAIVPAGAVAHVDGDPTNRWVTLEAARNASSTRITRAVAAESEVAGAAAVADRGTITRIATPFAGWLSVTNPGDALDGSAGETDADLAERVAQYAQGSAVTRALLRVPGVRSVAVEENDTDVTRTGTGGLPPHSVRVYAVGGTDAAVARAILSSVGPGIETHGDVVQVVDGRAVRFARPAEVDLFVRVEVEVDPDTYAGDAALRRTLAGLDGSLRIGATVLRSSVIVAARTVPGVTDCTEALLGASPDSLAPANVRVTAYQLARIASTRINIVRRS